MLHKKIKIVSIMGLICISNIVMASALEYHYTANLYSNHFYSSTSSNRALDIDSADDSGGYSIIIPSDSMSTDADNTAPRDSSPVIPVGSYIDPWGDAVEQQINADEKLNGLGGISFNRLAGTSTSSGSYTAQTQLVRTNGHFGAVSVGNRKLFAYVYPGATYESMRKGAGHVDGTSVWNGNVALCGHNRGSWPYFGTLKDVQIGDIITYRTSLGVRTYRVTSAGRILATNTAILNPTSDNRITLLTCIANEPAYRLCIIGKEI